MKYLGMKEAVSITSHLTVENLSETVLHYAEPCYERSLCSVCRRQC